MEIIIKNATINDVDKIENLYNDLLYYLENNINYPGWKKDIYPTRDDALNGIKEKNLYIAMKGDEIAGTIIINHKTEKAYKTASWHKDLNDEEIFVIHTFAVNPKYMKSNVGTKLLEFAYNLGKRSQMKALRLDVYEKNIPAIKLYEKFGFKYVDTVSLGLESYGLDYFKLYEKEL